MIALVAAAVTFLLIGEGDLPDKRQTTAAPALPSTEHTPRQPALARAVTERQLAAEAASLGRPLYWAGRRAGTTYELTRTADGRVYVRYLVRGAEVGSPSADFLAVATYPQTDGFEQVRSVAGKTGNVRIDLPARGVAVVDRSRASSVYLSYPGADYQVEVYSPEPGAAERLVRRGAIRPVGGGTPVSTGTARALGLAGLRRAASSRPLYWAGPRPSTRYELTLTPDSRAFVRYLTSGSRVGDPRANFLTIATYPQQDALAQVKAAGDRDGTVDIELDGGGLAVYDPARPTSVFLAYPEKPVQIEVFSPEAGLARTLVENDRIVPVR